MSYPNIPGHRLSILAVVIFISFILASVHIEKLTVKKSVPVSTYHREIIGVGKELPANPVDLEKVNYALETDKELAEGLDNLDRFSTGFLKLNAPFFRYKLTIRNTITGTISYQEDPTSVLTQRLFDSILSCDGKQIGVQDGERELRSRLRLNSEDDKKLIQNIIKSCLLSGVIGFKNTLGHSIFVISDLFTISPGSAIDLIIQLDLLSRLSIVLFWILVIMSVIAAARTATAISKR